MNAPTAPTALAAIPHAAIYAQRRARVARALPMLGELF